MIDVEIASPFYPDLSGAPLQNGSVYYGVSGQNPVTSPVSVYWDANGTQPAKQPIRVMNGLPTRNGSPAVVYISGDYSKLVLDGRGRQVSYVAAQSSRNLDTLPFTQAGIGAISMSAQAALRAVALTPEQFGAVGDGVADDTSALTKAWNAVMLVRGHLQLGPKVYRITAPMPTITVPCWISGRGAQKTWILYDKAAAGNAITTRNVWLGASSAQRVDPNSDTFAPSGDMTGVRITGFSLLGDRTTPNTQGGLIHLDRADNMYVGDIEVDNIKGVGWGFAEGASLNASCRESTFGRIEVRRCGDQATGRPGVHILTTGTAGADASNQISIQHLLSVWNDGCALKMENRNTIAARYIYIKQCMLHGRDSAGTNPMTENMLQVTGDWVAWGIEDLEMNGVRDGVWGIVFDRDPTTLLFPRMGKIHGSIGVKNGSTGNGVWLKYCRNMEFVLRDIAGATTHLQVDATISGPVIWDPVGNDSSWTYVFANTTTRDRLVRSNVGWAAENPQDTNGYVAQFKGGSAVGEPAVTQAQSTALGNRDVIRYRAEGFAELPFGYKLVALDPTQATDDPFRAYRETRGSSNVWVHQSSSYAARRAFMYGNALPTDGSWNVGDKVWNTSAAAGSNPGWVCTTAGVGGSTAVFKAMANLAA